MRPPSTKKYWQTNHSFILFVFIIAISLITYGISNMLQRRQVTQNPNPIIPTNTITYSTDSPDETPPEQACEDYTVANNEPRKIELPSIGASGCIQKVGLDQNNAIAVPTNVHVAGWYVESVLPTQPGLSIIDGHVLGRYGDAIFTNLKNLKQNDAMRIQLGDKSWHEFIVVSVSTYDVEETMSEVYKPFDGDNQLVLITCGGIYDKDSKTYSERVVVKSNLVK